MPIRTFLEERIRQQNNRRTVIRNLRNNIPMVGNRIQYNKNDLIEIDQDISDCKKCLDALKSNAITIISPTGAQTTDV